MKQTQLSFMDMLPKSEPAPLVTPEEAKRILNDFVYGERLALDATLDLLEAVRKTRHGVGVVSLAEGIERLKSLRFGLSSADWKPENDCLIWYNFINYHPSVRFGEYLEDRQLFARADTLLTVVNQAANGFIENARFMLGEDE